MINLDHVTFSLRVVSCWSRTTSASSGWCVRSCGCARRAESSASTAALTSTRASFRSSFGKKASCEAPHHLRYIESHTRHLTWLHRHDSNTLIDSVSKVNSYSAYSDPEPALNRFQSRSARFPSFLKSWYRRWHRRLLLWFMLRPFLSWSCDMRMGCGRSCWGSLHGFYLLLHMSEKKKKEKPDAISVKWERRVPFMLFRSSCCR